MISLKYLTDHHSDHWTWSLTQQNHRDGDGGYAQVVGHEGDGPLHDGDVLGVLARVEWILCKDGRLSLREKVL